MPGSNDKENAKNTKDPKDEVLLKTARAGLDDLEDRPEDSEEERERKKRERQMREARQARDAAYWVEFTRKRVKADTKMVQQKIENFERGVEENHVAITQVLGIASDPDDEDGLYEDNTPSRTQNEYSSVNAAPNRPVKKKTVRTENIKTPVPPAPEPVQETPEEETPPPVAREAKIEVKEKNFIRACREMLSIPAVKAKKNAEEYQNIIKALDEVEEVLKKSFATLDEAKKAYIKSVKKVLNNINRYRVHKASVGVDQNDVDNEKIIAIECVDQFLRMRYKEFEKKDYEEEIGGGKDLFNVNVDPGKEGDDYILDKGLSKIDNLKKEIRNIRAEQEKASENANAEEPEEPENNIDEDLYKPADVPEEVHDFVDELLDEVRNDEEAAPDEEEEPEEVDDEAEAEERETVRNFVDNLFEEEGAGLMSLQNAQPEQEPEENAEVPHENDEGIPEGIQNADDEAALQENVIAHAENPGQVPQENAEVPHENIEDNQEGGGAMEEAGDGGGYIDLANLPDLDDDIEQFRFDDGNREEQRIDDGNNEERQIDDDAEQLRIDDEAPRQERKSILPSDAFMAALEEKIEKQVEEAEKRNGFRRTVYKHGKYVPESKEDAIKKQEEKKEAEKNQKENEHEIKHPGKGTF